MGAKELLAEALKLNPEDRFSLVEGILYSLDRPEAAIDAIWIDEAEKRLQAYREGRLETVAFEDVFPGD